MNRIQENRSVRRRMASRWLIAILVGLPILALADNPPPGVPTADWIAKNATTVLLGWQAPADGDLAGYKVYFGADSRPYPSYQDVGNVLTIQSNTSTLAFAGEGVAVTAYDTQGNEGDYAELGVVAGNAPPSNLSANPASSSQIDVLWNQNHPNEDGFLVRGRVQGAPSFSTLATTGPFGSGITGGAAVTGLEGCTTYEFEVVAFVNAGSTQLVSDASNTASATTTGTNPAAPSNLAGSAVSGPAVNLTWTDNSASTPCAADSFGIFRNDVEIKKTTGPTTSYSDTTVTSGNSYSYKVRAYRGAQFSAFSNTINVNVGGSTNVNVPGTRHKDNKVSVNVPADVTVTISNVGGTVCLGGAGIVCTGPAGVSASTCNETTNECVCPAQCGSQSYGELLRSDSCLPVSNGQTFNSGGGTVQFFVNGDCNPDNNSGSFNLTLSY